MSYLSQATNARSMNGIISFDDGLGGVLEGGQLNANKMVCPVTEATKLVVDNLLLTNYMQVSGLNITATTLSYLYGVTSNIQTQFNNILTGHLASNNTWTGTNIFNGVVTFGSSVIGLTKSMVGLSNVDNTTDLLKPVSTATQTALNLKANIASPNFTGTVSSTLLKLDYTSGNPPFQSGCGSVGGNVTGGHSDLSFINSGVAWNNPAITAFGWFMMTSSTTKTTLATLSTAGALYVLGAITSPTITTINSNIALKANIASPTFTGTVSGVTKAMVGLGNCDNTTDLLKPVSTATQTALNLKANIASPTFTGTVSGVTKAMVGLGNCDDTTDLLKPVSTATQTALDLKANIASPTFTGTVSGITSAMVGLGNCDNTSDVNKPVSTATQTALNLKANIASPTFTGTVSGITKVMVGLGNCDDTNDLLKPVSTATQTALNLKANIASPNFTGTVSSTLLKLDYTSDNPPFQSGCGSVGGNVTGGHSDLSFINSGVAWNNPAITAFGWFVMTSSTTKTEVAHLKTNGAFNVIGTVSCPTVKTPQLVLNNYDVTSQLKGKNSWLTTPVSSDVNYA